MPWQDVAVALIVALAVASLVRRFAPRRRDRKRGGPRHRDRPDVPVSRLVRRGRRQAGGRGRGCCGDNKR